jgi:hypothetical protein
MGCAASAPYSSTASSPGGKSSIHTFIQSLRPWDDGNDIVDTTTTNEPIEEIYYYNQRRLACPTAAAVAVCCVRRGKKDRQSYHMGMINQRQSIMKVYDDSRTLSSCDRTAVIANVDWKTPGNDDDDDNGRGGAPDGSPTRGRRPSPSSSSTTRQTEVIRVEPAMVWDDESPLTRTNNLHHRQQTTYPSNYLLRTPGTSVSVTPNSEEKEVYIAERRQRMELLRKSLSSLNEVHISDSGGGAEGPYLGSTYWTTAEYNTNNNSSINRNSNSSHEMVYMTPIESVSPQMEYITPIDDCSATQKKTQTSLSTKDHLARLGLALFNNDDDDDDEMYNKTPNSSCSTSASENTPIDNLDIYEDDDNDDGYLLPPQQHDHAAASSLLDISSDLLDYSNMTEENNNRYGLVSHYHQHHAAASSLLDISSDLLDLSLVNTTGEQSYSMPRRLFDDDHSNDGYKDDDIVVMSNTIPKLPPSPKDTPPMRRQRLHSGGGANKQSSTTSNVGIPSSLSSLRNLPYVSPLNVTPGGSFDDDHDTTKHMMMMEQRISTLPSLEHAKPIRLYIEEKSSKIAVVSNSSSTTPKTPATPEDEYYFSYDPHFPLMSEYNISNYYDGRPYGNGLVIKMGGYDGRRRRRRKNINNNNAHSSLSSPQSGGFASASQFMILEDRIGNVPCVIKSLRTHIPSMILYSPKARYVGQKPSAHRLVSRHKEDEGMISNAAATTTTTVIDDNGERDDNSVALYPWALIGKSGRTREDECMIHLVKIHDSAMMKDNTAGRSSPPLTSNSIFHSNPSFRGRHGFDECGLHTHTVVHRITSPMKSTEKITNTLSSNSETNVILDGGVPCCLMIRDPSNVDTTDLTIAPGIDPLLMICYLTCHTKMDVECIITGF